MNTTLWFSSLFDQITDQQEQKIYENFYIKNLRENLWTQERVSNWRGVVATIKTRNMCHNIEIAHARAAL
jgi:hypothetical protein